MTNSSSSDFHFTNPIFTTTAEIGGLHYALTASEADSRIQITDITDPASPQATASIAHLPNGFNIRFVSSITATEIDGSHYAIVTAAGSGVQIINITDPAAPQVAAFMPDIGTIHGGLTAVTTTTEIDGSPHVLVADFDDDTIHIIEIADPTAPRLVVSVKPKEGIFDQMDQPLDVAATVIDGSHYALIASSLSDGIQIIEITVPSMPTNPLLPSVAMDVGPVPRHAAYSGFDGNQTMIFKYVVTDGDHAGDLGYDGSGALDLKSNLLRTAGNDAAVILLPLPEPGTASSLSHNKDIRINTLRVASATYAAGNGTLTIEFNVPLSVTVNYDRLHIRDAGHGSGGLSLGDVADRSAAGSYVTATLSDAQRAIINGMTEPQLDMTDGAVSDLSGNPVDGATDLVIRVLPRASPAVQAGDDQTVGEGDVVTLSGVATDPNGDPITYTWSQTRPSTPNITFANSSRADTTFVAPMVTGDTTFILTLTANDGADSAEDTLEITVKETGAAFITTWAATEAHRDITLPMTGAYSVLWGDDSYDAGVDNSTSHTYGTAGTYTVTILGDGLERINLSGDATNALYLESIEQWGGTKWAAMDDAFAGATYMKYNATDVPDLSEVTSMSYMFEGATAFNGDLAAWDVSSVTDMSGMFASASSFNQTLNDWNVSSVINTSHMFFGASSFDRPLNDWNVSSVNNTSYMFLKASSFNQTLNNWDVSSVTDMTGMFDSATAFNGDLAAWNVSSVTDMSGMFLEATDFNQTLNNWNVSSVTDMKSMFLEATAFNGDLAAWDVSSVNNTSGMFDGASAFDGDLSAWNVSSVTDMSDMFSYATAFNQNLGNWYVVPDSVSIAWTDVPGIVGSISAQNKPLDNHDPEYNIGTGGNSTRFEIVNYNQLNMTSVDAESAYTVNVTASKGTVFEDGNNWRILDVTVTTTADDTPPDMILDGSDYIEITVYDTYDEEGATCTDAVDGDIDVIVAGDVVVATAGTYYVTYSCTDAVGNEAKLTRTVVVKSPPPLVIAITGNNPVTVLINTLYMDEGATCTSNVGGVPMPLPPTDNVNTAVAGNYTVNYSCLVASTEFYFVEAYRTVIVTATATADDTPPVIALMKPDTFTTTVGTSYIDAGATCTDDVDGPITPTQTSTVDTSTAGPYTVTYSCTDAANNDATPVSRTVTVMETVGAFITTWAATSSDRGITLPMTGTYSVVWGDGSHDAVVINSTSHTYGTAGNYTVTVLGDGLERINLFSGDANAHQLESIEQWGGTKWTTMENAFDGATSMVYNATDAPDLSKVTSMRYMFKGATAFNGNLASWNVSSVTNMSGMFSRATSFNGDLSSWNVSSVNDMNGMFDGASDFNGDLSAWNVSSVTDMGNMFDGATAFNQNLGNWYVVPDSVSIAWTDVPGIVGSISAQNTALDEHNPVYNVTGSDPTRFAIVNGNQLNMTSVGTKSAYTVNVTASEGTVFEDGNNWRILDVTVDTPPVIRLMGLNVITITVGGTYDEPGAVCEDDVDADKAATVGDDRVDTTMAGTYSVNYSCEDTAGNDATQVSRTVTVIEPVAPFITTWTATNSDKSITLPMKGTYTILWGDGSNSTNVSDSQSHTYSTAGDYAVTVLGGGLDSISLYDPDDKPNALQLKSIDQWGDTEWQSMDGAFESASNMVYRATDAPDLSDLNYMGYMFFGASTFNANLSSWNVSSVTHMEYMFAETSSFNANLSSWDVSSVTDMNNMFFKASSFNGNLSSWDVSKVTLMYGMFSGASSFNGNLSSWDVSKVTLMYGMFSGASSFNGNLSLWDVSSVTAMNNMFNGASSFNRPLNSWNVSSVDYMDYMFDDADSFDQNLGTWYIVPADTNFVVGGTSLDITTILTQNRHLRDQTPTYGIGSGDHSDLFEMRGSTLAFRSTPSADTYQANVTASGNNVFESGNNWRVLDITVPDSPPTVHAGGDQTVGEGDTVTLSGSAMDPDGDPITYTWLQTGPAAPSIAFVNSSAPSTTFTAPAVTGDTTFTITLTADGGGQSVEDTLKITVKETGTAFITTWAVSDSDRDITLPMNGTYSILWGDGYQSADVRDPQSHTYGAAGNYTVTVLGEGLENIRLSDDISNAKKLRSIEQWGGTEWTTMSKAFSRTSNMAYNAIDSPNLSKVNNTSSMFDGASSFNGDLSGWNVSSVTDMSYMFFGASSFDRPLNTWDVSSVTDMSYMFWKVSSFDRPLNSWNVSSVIGMDFMFFQASAFNQNLGTWYIVLDDTVIDLADTGNDIGSISAQNSALDVHSPTYGLDTNLFSQKFAISGNDLQVKPGEDYPNETYNIIITATGTNLFGTDNRITVGVRVTDTTPSNRPPSVNAGDDQDAVEGSTVTLDASVSDLDTENDLTYAWTHNSTFSITLVGGDTAAPTFTAPRVSEETTIEFTLTVNDGTVDVTDKIIVTVTDSANRPPSVNAGDDQDAVEGSTVTLDASVSDLDTENDLTYAWTHNSTFSITLVGGDTAAPTFTAPRVSEETTIEFTLTVNDGTVDVTDKIIVTVTDSANRPPSVNAGDDQDAVEGSTVTLDASVSDLDTENDLTYAWTHNSTFSITLVGGDTAAPTFTAPRVSEETTIEFTLTVNDGTVDVTDKIIVTVTDSANRPPSVNAGDDQDAVEGSTVTLDASVSDLDTENDLTYAWTHNSTFSITLVGGDTAAPTFTAPRVSEETTIEFTLTVNDGTVDVTDKIIVTVTDSANRPPSVNAGDDQDAVEGSTVTLDASVSDLDTENDLTYAWTHNSTFSITLVGGDTAAPTFTAPRVSEETTIEFTLTVNDGTVDVTDKIIVTVTDSANRPPSVNAGDDQDAVEGSTVTLDASVSDLDTENDLTYAWTHNSTFSITLVGGDTVAPTFTAPRVSEETTIEFTLTVNDGTVDVTDKIIVTVTDSANRPPSVNAGDDQDAVEGSTVTLDASVSDLDTENDLTYAWTHNSTFSITLVGGDTAAPTFTAPRVSEETTIEFTLTVNDGTVDVTDKIIVTVTDSANRPPSVNAGDDQDAVEGSTVTLDASVSDLDTENDLTYAWTHNSTFSITLVGGDTAAPTFTAPRVSEETTIEFTLTVNDGTVDVTDKIIVTVTDSANRPPSVNAGDDQDAVEGSTVTLDASVSDLDTENDLTYAWTHNSTFSITLVGGDTVAPTFTAPRVSEETTIEFTLTVNDGTVDVTDKIIVTVTDSANRPPSVNAGDDQDAVEGSTVTLDASVSDLDTENDLTYAWTHNSTFSITLVGGDTAAPTFTAPRVSEETTIEFTLTVNDGTVDVTDKIIVTVTDSANRPPSVNAGDDQDAVEGSTVTLDASVSDLDTENDLTYAWTHNSTFSITLVGGDTAAPTFTAPRVSEETTIEFTLTVNDGTVDVTDKIIVTVTDSANRPPSVNAGDDQDAVEGSTVTLDASVSDLDTENDLTYAWTHNSTFSITLVGGDTAAPTFTAPRVSEETTIEFTLTVNDGTVDVTDKIIVTVTDSANRPPSVNAGDDQDAVEGSTVTLDASVSDLDTENDLTYAWTHNSTFSITLVGGDTAAPTFTAPRVSEETTIEFTLTVNDGTVDVTDKIIVTVTDSANRPPSVNAGDDQDAVEGSTVTLDASVSDLDTENDLTYAWTHNSTFSITLVGGDTAAPTFTAPRVSEETTIEFTLTVNDGTVDVTDKIIVTVTDSANRPPSVNAGDDQDAVEGSTVTLDASVSDLDTENDLTYAWTHNSTFSITLVGGDTAAPTFTAPRVSEETTIEFTLTVNDGTVDVADKIIVTVTDSANRPPSVNAGDDQDAVEGSTVTLDASVSDLDTENDLTYAWTHNSTFSITLVGGDTAAPTFTAPRVSEETTIEFTLTVNDGTVDVTDKIIVTVTDSANRPPSVNAGDDQDAVEGSTVTLDASVSDLDTENDLTYAWTHNSTFSITLVGGDTAAPTFTAPRVSEETTIEFTLTVNDGTVDVTDKIIVTVTDSANRPPSVNAGDDQDAVEGSTVTLDASVSDLDTENDLTYAWTHNSTFSITLVGGDTAAPTFTAPRVSEETTIEFTLTVNDGTVDVTDKIIVTVTDSANRPPSVNAGDDQDAVEGSTVTLDASVSDLDTENDLTYAWTHNSTFSITLVGGDTAAPTFTAPRVSEETTIEFTLTVNDGTVDVADKIIVTVTDSANRPPSVNAGDDQDAVEGSTVTLDASVSDLDTENDLTYAWTHNSTFSITLVGGDTAAPTFTAPRVSEETTIEFTLTVNDGTVDVTDKIIVTVTDSANRPPSVNAGDDQDAVEGSTVTLDASVSDLDTENDLTYAWTHNSTFSITLVGGDTAAPTFTAPRVSEETTIEFTLTVNDGTVDVTDKIIVTVTDSANRPPSVNAGDDQDAVEGSTVTLDASVSDLDTENDLTYAWTHNSTFSITLVGGDTAAPTFTAPRVSEETTIEFTLTVNDGTVDVTDKIIVTVTDSANRPPSVNAGDDQDAVEGSTVTLDASVSDLDTENDLTYAWTHNSTFSITLVGGDTAAPTFTAPRVSEETTIEFTLTVNDGTVDVTDKIIVTVTDSANRPPSVNAGDDQDAVEGSTVTLDASVSDLDTENDLTYAWTHNSTFSISFGNSSAVDTTFTAPNVSEETTIEFTLTVNDGTVDVTDKIIVTVTDSANRPPSVNAGDDQDAVEGSTVTLDASVSDLDTENDLTYAWTHNSTFSITLVGGDTAAPTFTAPRVSEETTIEFTLTVNDGTVDVTDKIIVTVTDSANRPPSVNAGDDQDAVEGSTVTLDASVSDLDTENDLTYAWTHNSTFSISFGNSSAVDTTFTAPNVSEETTIEFTLTVNDGTVDVTDKIIVTVTDSANRPPSVNAGDDQDAVEGSTVTLDASVSDLDTENDLTYAWTHNSTFSITLVGGDTAAPTFTAPRVSEETTIEFTLTVNDGTVDVTDKIIVTVTDSANRPPSVNAGDDQDAVEGSTVTLDASVSDLDTENDLTYAWTHNSTFSISFGNSSAVDTTFTAPNVSEETTIEFTLTVNDGTVDVTDKIIVTVTDSANRPPSVNAGDDQDAVEGSTVTLDASVSDLDTENDLTYAWTHNSTFSITLVGGDTAAPTFTAPRVSEETTIEFTLTVNDGTVDVTDKIIVTVTDSANRPPSVNAGDDQDAVEGSTVTLDASVSDLDTENDLTYAWTHNSTFSISFGNSSAVDTTFTAPNVSEETTIEFTLTVNDGTVDVTDKIIVTVTDSANRPPSVNAGDDQDAVEGSTVTLDASVSDLDTENDLTYAWTHNSTFSITLVGGDTAAPTFTAPRVSEETTIEFTLTVNDGTVDVTDKIIVTVTDSANRPPSVNAGDDQDAVEGSTVTLDASVSDLDTENDLTYAWTHNSTFSISFGNSSAVDTTFTAPNVSEETTIEFTLTVNDGTVDVTDKIIVTVTDSANRPPSVNAGDDQDAVEGSTVTLDASVSDLDTENDLTYAWTHNSTFSITLVGGDTAAPTFTAPRVSEETTIEFTLTVNDGTVDVTDKIIVTVTDSANRPPSVNAGDDQDAVEGSTVTLDASVSDLDTENDLTYAWTHNSTFSISFGNSSAVDTTFTAPNVSEETTIEFTLTVNDGTATVSDKTIVTVTDSANRPPAVDAGQNMTVNERAAVTLSGSASDPDAGDTITYAWTRESGPPVTLTGADTARPQFTAPGVRSDEVIVFRLTVTYGAGTSADDTVAITVRDVPMTVSSAAYSPGTRIVSITFNQDIGSTPDYSRMHVRSAGSDSGGITLSEAAATSYSGRTITVMLDPGQQNLYNGLQGPQLDVDGGAITDLDGVLISETLNHPIRSAGQDRRSSSQPPAVGLDAFASIGVDIPPQIAELYSSRGDGPIAPVTPDGTFDFPLVMDGWGYLLDGQLDTLVPHSVTTGRTVEITFTVYAKKEIMHFGLYLNLHGAETGHARSDTYVEYNGGGDSGTTAIIDPHWYIADAFITVRADSERPEKKYVTITIEFGNPMGPTNMVAYLWDTDRRSTILRMIDALDVVETLPPPPPELDVLPADPEPAVPDSEMPADPEPAVPDSGLPADPEPVPRDTPWPDDYDDAQVLTLIRMWSGFESESITDAQLLELLGLEDYRGVDLPDWMMTELGVLVARGDVTVGEFMLALQYVLEHT